MNYRQESAHKQYDKVARNESEIRRVAERHGWTVARTAYEYNFTRPSERLFVQWWPARGETKINHRPGPTLKSLTRLYDFLATGIVPGHSDTSSLASPGVQELHAQGLCTWIAVFDRWCVFGPEALLRSGRVLVKARSGEPHEVEVTNVRQVGERWIADRACAFRK